MWELVGNHEDRFSHNEAHISLASYYHYGTQTNSTAPDEMPQNIVSYLGLTAISSKNEKLFLISHKLKMDSTKCNGWESPLIAYGLSAILCIDLARVIAFG